MYHFQLSIFYDLQFLIQTSSFYRKYYLLFNSLNLSSVKEQNYSIGRTGYSRHAMIRAFVVKHFERIKSVPKLIEFLEAHPILSEMCGFTMGVLPDASQFYRFLSDTPVSMLENLHHGINKELIANNAISTSHFIADSKPIMAATRDNNMKNPNRNTRDKNRIPRRNPAATLAYYSYQEFSGKKKYCICFWGYRTHVLVTKEGVALVSLTLPNNYTDAKVARKLLKKLKRVYGLKKGSIFIADAAYDERELYTFISEKLKCKAFIPLNPRNTQQPKTFGPHGSPLCDAGLEMKSNGCWTEELRTRIKYRCPIKLCSKTNKHYQNACPIHHPRFSEGAMYGCTKYLDVSDDARARVARDSLLFKQTFKLRTEVERYFARLGDREVEQTTHYKMRSIKNQMTIAHLSMSLLAYAAAILLNQPQKIRCYQTFAAEPLPMCA